MLPTRIALLLNTNIGKIHVFASHLLWGGGTLRKLAFLAMLIVGVKDTYHVRISRILVDVGESALGIKLPLVNLQRSAVIKVAWFFSGFSLKHALVLADEPGTYCTCTISGNQADERPRVLQHKKTTVCD